MALVLAAHHWRTNAGLIAKGKTKPLTAVMLALGQEIDDARQAAQDAVLNGGDVLGLYLEYRRTCARVAGQWRALSGAYRQATGRNAPVGPVQRIPPRTMTPPPGHDQADHWAEGATARRSTPRPRRWKRLRAVLERDDDQCQLPDCLRDATEVDHIGPADNHDIENLRAVCSLAPTGQLVGSRRAALVVGDVAPMPRRDPGRC